MTNYPDVPPPRLCPLCGTKASETATRCQVCGTNLTRPRPRVLQPARRPSPVFIALVALFVFLGAALVAMATGAVPMPAFLLVDTPTITPTFTPLPTPTPTATPSATPVPTPTPLPPIPHVVADGDSCLLLAIIYGVSVESIIDANNLDPACTISIGWTLKIPRPTPTLPPPPTVAPVGSAAAAASAGTPLPAGPAPGATYIVQPGDTCLGIALQHYTTVEEIQRLNQVGDCNFLGEGQVLILPATVTPAATATPAK